VHADYEPFIINLPKDRRSALPFLSADTVLKLSLVRWFLENLITFNLFVYFETMQLPLQFQATDFGICPYQSFCGIAIDFSVLYYFQGLLA
jgi:hypothetical protein